jgi:hypothetical protein
MNLIELKLIKSNKIKLHYLDFHIYIIAFFMILILIIIIYLIS